MSVLSGLPDPNASAGDSTTDGNLTDAVRLSGSIPKTYIDGTTLVTPWGATSKYVITYKGKYGSGDHEGEPYAEIVGTDLPNYACQNLAAQFPVGKNNVTGSSCDTTKGTLTIDYVLSNRQGVVVNSETNASSSDPT